MPIWAEKLFSALVWLAVWQAAYLIVGKDLLLASPLNTLKALMALCGKQTFWSAVGGSLLRMLISLISGVALGVILAGLLARFRLLNAVFRPLLSVIRSTPVTSFILLALVWLSASNVPVLTGILMVVPIIWANVTQGIESLDSGLLEMAEIYKFSPVKRLRHLYIPSVMPHFIAGVKTSVGLCWKACIAAEVIGTPKNAIGSMLYNTKIYLETENMFAFTITVIVISMALERLFRLLLQLLANKEGSAYADGI